MTIFESKNIYLYNVKNSLAFWNNHQVGWNWHLVWWSTTSTGTIGDATAVPLLLLDEFLESNFFLFLRQNGLRMHSGLHAAVEATFLTAPPIIQGQDALVVVLADVVRRSRFLQKGQFYEQIFYQLSQNTRQFLNRHIHINTQKMV